MILQSQIEVDNTRKKLAALEQFYAEREADKTGAPYPRQLSLRSLRRTINQLTEEIVRYESKVKSAIAR
jgi:hypothetical protein